MRVPKHLIRASSCSGMQPLVKAEVAKLALKQVSRDLSKPKTKCQFTQLQIIRQKDSSGSIGNE